MRYNTLFAFIVFIFIVFIISLTLPRLQYTGKIVGSSSGSFTVLDEAPNLYQLIPNVTTKPNVILFYNLTNYFTEPNDQNMTFSITMIPDFTAYLDNVTANLTLVPDLNFKGRRSFIVTAYDSSMSSASSNNATIVLRDRVINYSTFTGQTTDFDFFTDDELEALTDVVLEKEYGKVFFPTLNISDDADFDSYLWISFANITANLAGLPLLNRSATLTFYNITDPDFNILQDGEICSSPDCVIVSNSGGELVINVTRITSFFIEGVTPPVVTPTGPQASHGAPHSTAYPVYKGEEEEVPPEVKEEDKEVEKPVPPPEEKPEEAEKPAAEKPVEEKPELERPGFILSVLLPVFLFVIMFVTLIYWYIISQKVESELEQLRKLVKEKKKLDSQHAAAALGLTEERIESLAKILEKEKALSIAKRSKGHRKVLEFTYKPKTENN